MVTSRICDDVQKYSNATSDSHILVIYNILKMFLLRQKVRNNVEILKKAAEVWDNRKNVHVDV